MNRNGRSGRLASGARTALWAVASLAVAIAACNSNGASPSVAPGGAGAAGGSAAVDLAMCTKACTSDGECGEGLSCVASAHGNKICKPTSCPACGSKYCLVNDADCTPLGCTSATCGFNNTGSCDDCAQASCCGLLTTCADDPACAAIVTCEDACHSDGACLAQCTGSASAAALAEFTSAFNCLGTMCNEQCYNGMATGAGGSGTTVTCPAADPIYCGGDLCCPNEFPVCHGPCGQNCCAKSTGTGAGGNSGTGAGGTSSTCPADNPIYCGGNLCCPTQYPVCHGSCGQNCCAGSPGAGAGAGPGAGAGGSGAGGTTSNPSCQSLDSCISVTSTTTANGTSCTGAELYATLVNNCGQAAYCRVCPVVNGAINEAACGASSIQAGQTQSGEGAGWWWCSGSSVKYLCSPIADPTSCVQF